MEICIFYPRQKSSAFFSLLLQSIKHQSNKKGVNVVCHWASLKFIFSILFYLYHSYLDLSSNFEVIRQEALMLSPLFGSVRSLACGY